MTSSKPKIQRLANASEKSKSTAMRAPLSKGLQTQYGIRTIAVRKGDTVLVSRGDYEGHEGKVAKLAYDRKMITVEGVNTTKLDGKTKPVFISPTKVKVTKIDLSDKMRKKSIERKGKESRVETE